MPTWYKSQANKITISRVKANYLPSLFLYIHIVLRQYSAPSQGNGSLLTLATPWVHLGYTLGTPWLHLGYIHLG